MDFKTHILVLPRNLFFNRAKTQLAPELLSPCQKEKSPHFPRELGRHLNLLQSSHKVPDSPTYGPGFPPPPPTSGEANDKCIILFWWIKLNLYFF